MASMVIPCTFPLVNLSEAQEGASKLHLIGFFALANGEALETTARHQTNESVERNHECPFLRFSSLALHSDSLNNYFPISKLI